MVTISESLANEIGLEGATVYSYVSIILSTDFYKERFKGCRVKGKKYTAFISISKLKEIIPFLSTKKLYNAMNLLVETGYLKELPLRKPGLNTTRCYQLVNVSQHFE